MREVENVLLLKYIENAIVCIMASSKIKKTDNFTLSNSKNSGLALGLLLPSLTQSEYPVDTFCDFIRKAMSPYRKQIDDADTASTPPWVKRKVYEKITIDLEPVLCLLTFALRIATEDSIDRNFQRITEYLQELVNDKRSGIDLSKETQLILIGCAMSGQQFRTDIQLSPIFYAKNPNTGPEYDGKIANWRKLLRENQISNYEGVWINTGAFSTKKDLQWFIDQHWAEIRKQLPLAYATNHRKRNTFLRQIVIHWLAHYNFSNQDILNILNESFPDNLTDKLEISHIGTDVNYTRTLLNSSPFAGVHTEYKKYCRQDPSLLGAALLGLKVFDLYFDSGSNVFHIKPNK